MSTFSLRPNAKAGHTYDLLIYGDIGSSWFSEGVEAKDIARQIDQLPDSVKTLNVRINSFGGSVSEGFGVHNAIRAFKGKSVAVIEGVACSIASLIMMAADEVQAYPQSLILVHAPWSGASGNAKDMRKTADVLDKWAEAMVSAYTRKGTMTEADVRQLLTSGEDHWYTADEAKAAGLIDSILDDADEMSDPAKAMLDRAPTAMRFAALAAFRGVVPPQNNQPQEVPVVEVPQTETPVATAVDDVQARVDAAVQAAVAAAVAKVEADAQARVSEAQAAAAEAQARAAAEVEAREVRDAVEHAAKTFAHVPGDTAELGRTLRTVAKVAPEAAAVLERVLKSADAALAAGVLTTPVGASGNVEMSVEDRLESLVKAKCSENPKLTAIEARSMVYTENADIVAALRGEKD